MGFCCLPVDFVVGGFLGPLDTIIANTLYHCALEWIILKYPDTFPGAHAISCCIALFDFCLKF